VRVRRGRRAPAPPPEQTVADWLVEEYVGERLTLEQLEVKLDELAAVLDSPRSVVKYMLRSGGVYRARAPTELTVRYGDGTERTIWT